MTRVILAAGVAALAITAPAASAPAGKHGGADRTQRAETTKAQKSRDGEARAQRSARVERSGSTRVASMQQPRRERAERTQVRERPARVQRAERTQVRERPARVQRQERRAERVQARPERRSVARVDRTTRQVERQTARTDRQAARTDRQAQRVDRQAQRVDRQALRTDRQAERMARNDRAGFITARNSERLQRVADRQVARAELRALNDARILPVTQAATFIGEPLSVVDQTVRLQALPNRLQYVYADTPDYYYRYGNGYLYQVNRSDNLIAALLPLFGLGLNVGQPFPMAYSNYYMPTGLQPFYTNSSCGYSPYGYNDYYRYVNGYVYEIDCRTGLVEDIDPLLGYGYGYGQMMPMAYSAYNVPYQYRSMYYDTSDYYYRYAPGAIYQVDPTTSLITAVAALLTGGLNVGQPLPVGYSAYNVPLAYRTTYYDTPNAWYRYADGYIYRVNPVNGLVTDRVVVVV